MNTKKQNVLFIVLIIGVWVLVFQNAGIIPTKQNVYVKGGYIDADVSGSVDVDNSVDVNGEVDVNIEAINGHRNVFFNNPRRGEENKYYVIPVSNE